MLVSVDEARNYLAIDHEEDNLLITALIEAAEAYLESQIGISTDLLPNRAKSVAKVLILQLVSTWYDERSIMSEYGEATKRLLYAISAILKAEDKK